MGLTILPQKFYDTLDTQNTLLASIASNVGTAGITISNWADVQRLVRMGLADKMFSVGDQFVTTYDAGQITWDVIGINHDIPTDTKYTNSLTLQAHDCVMNCQFDAPEALYYAETELAPGNYYFTCDATTYQFSLTQAVPAGGQIMFPWVYGADILATKISTYASKTATTATETDITVAVGSTGTILTPINDTNRCRYGSSNYVESNVRKFLNGEDTTFAWVAQTNYDRPSAGLPYAGAGFLSLLDPDLAAVLGAVNKQVTRNTITDGGGQDLFSDKVFLLSRVEIFGGDEGVITGENPYAYYSALVESPSSVDLAGRIKYLSGSARDWWLRSPSTGYSCGPRSVTPTGGVSSNNAYHAIGLAPACCIV